MSASGFSVNRWLHPLDRVILAANYVFVERASGITVAAVNLDDGREAQVVLTANRPDPQGSAANMAGLVRYPDGAVAYEHHMAPALLGTCAINVSQDCMYFRATGQRLYRPTDEDPSPIRDVVPKAAQYGAASLVESFATGELWRYDHAVNPSAREAVTALHGLGHHFRDPALQQFATTFDEGA